MRIWGHIGSGGAGATEDIAAGPQLVCACGAMTPLAAMRGPGGRRRLICRACDRVLLDQQREAARPPAPVGLSIGGARSSGTRARVLHLR